MSDCASKGRLNDALDDFSARELARLLNDWEFIARRDQWPPDLAANGLPWRVWLILGGRGAGKTRAGAEWVKGLALRREQFCVRPIGRIALIGETAADVRDVMIEGVSGLLAVHGKRDPAALGKFAPPHCLGFRRRRAGSFRRKTPKACAARNSTPPGATNSPNGATPGRHGTCCNSVCASATGRASS